MLQIRFAQSQRTSSKELQKLHWSDVSVHNEHVHLTEEELSILTWKYQWELYTELHGRVEAAGGELKIDFYIKFLLEELENGPYWDLLGLDVSWGWGIDDP